MTATAAADPSADHAVALRGLVKRYGRRTALRGVDVTLARGELVGLLGPNGAGKSTLVKIVCGLVRKTGGTARVFGQSAGSRAARQRIGYLAETFRYPAWARADELLALHQRLAGSEGGTAERAALLERVGLPEAAALRVDEMSKGMQQRLGLAQALVGDPRLLLLDEPTSALDPVGRRLVRDVLADLRDRGVTVLLNSHLLSEVELVCDRVVILRAGAVVTEGAPHDLARPRGVRVDTDRGSRVVAGVTRADIPTLVARLVADGEQVFEVTPLQSTLEEVYLEAVAGDTS
ncbi:MAG TPA: ABC transporter ATP-binding protein [Mycobacteriales bacterium]|nr:ABC transporter ATP-binding protein [Mycobacteriales bacterium]